MDFFRISVLNTLFVAIALLYIKPRDFLRKLFSKSIRQHFMEQVNNPEITNVNIALSIGLGVFMGIAPIWGYQMITAVFVAHLMKLNKPLTLIFSNISIPPLIPVILFFSVKTGELLSGTETGIGFHTELTFDTIKSLFLVYLSGSIVFGLLMALLSGLTALLLLATFRKTDSVH
jgi:uncharacterized protein (DUF2062 family)